MTLTNLRTAAASSLAAAGLLLSLAACSTPAANQPAASPTASAPSASASANETAANEPCDGVKVIVDSGALEQDAADKNVCVPVEGPTVASKLLEEAQIETEGTTKYPNELVCRVNGVPAADFDIKHKGGTYREECKDMPAAFAYWALWVKPSADGEWAYAQEGLATLKVSPGQSLELLYTVDGAPAAPVA